jgi:hypothetical protein
MKPIRRRLGWSSTGILVLIVTVCTIVERLPPKPPIQLQDGKYLGQFSIYTGFLTSGGSEGVWPIAQFDIYATSTNSKVLVERLGLEGFPTSTAEHDPVDKDNVLLPAPHWGKGIPALVLPISKHPWPGAPRLFEAGDPNATKWRFMLLVKRDKSLLQEAWLKCRILLGLPLDHGDIPWE